MQSFLGVFKFYRHLLFRFAIKLIHQNTNVFGFSNKFLEELLKAPILEQLICHIRDVMDCVSARIARREVSGMILFICDGLASA